ncbi:MAG: TrmH family RNA methyltransferase [Spirochaetaceae bacterium]|jgi:TrmH family RNA methyltransferase|nr:TrmH family RNA methyltransferase [Spirochaetaceae bacterium]
MITLRKLASLKDGTRFRKYPLLLQSLEYDIKNKNMINTLYFHGLMLLISTEDFYPLSLRVQAEELKDVFQSLDNKTFLRKCNSLRYGLLASIGAEPGDWDFEEDKNSERKERISGELNLFLDGIRSPFNVGSIFRSAESFGIKKIYLSEETASPEHNRAKRSSMGCTDIVPWTITTIDKLGGPFFALELGGISLNDFTFPNEGTLIVGSEELGVSPDSLIAADASLGRLSIRTGGIKGSLNVSVASGIALQKWFSAIF